MSFYADPRIPHCRLRPQRRAALCNFAAGSGRLAIFVAASESLSRSSMAAVMSMADIQAAAERVGINLAAIDLDAVHLPPGDDFGVPR